MPVQHIRPNRTGILPTTSVHHDRTDEPNWMKTQRQPLLDTPAVTTFTNSTVLPHGLPGGSVLMTFQPVGIIYDRYFIVGPTATQNLRIPWDGIYDITIEFQYHDPNTNSWEVMGLLQQAPTSDSGFAVPVFSNLIDPTGNPYEFYALQPLASTAFQGRYNTILRGIELHANDSLRFQLQQSTAAAADAHVWFNFFDVRWCCPIPNNQINIGQQ